MRINFNNMPENFKKMRFYLHNMRPELNQVLSFFQFSPGGREERSDGGAYCLLRLRLIIADFLPCTLQLKVAIRPYNF